MHLRLGIKMKKKILVALSMTWVVFLVPLVDARQVHVKGYYRKDGTYVRPHVRNVGGSSRSSHFGSASSSSGSFGPRTFYSGSGTSHYSDARTSNSESPGAGPIFSFSKSSSTNSSSVLSPVNTTSPSESSVSSYNDSRGNSGTKHVDYQSPSVQLPAPQAVTPTEPLTAKSPSPPSVVSTERSMSEPALTPNVKSTVPPDRETVLRDSKLRIETLATIDTLRNAITRYMTQNGRVTPNDLAELSTTTNDAWGRSLYYETDKKDYAIASDGPDGIPNTNDDIIFLSCEQPLCQAVLPDGNICRRKTEAKSWYCITHTIHSAVKASPDEKAGHVSKKKALSSGTGLRVVLDTVLFLLATGVIVASFCWMTDGKRQDGR